MKKITAILCLAMGCSLGYGQGNGHHGNSNDEHWDIFGNGIDASDVFGSTNNFPLKFITNSIQRMTLDVNGNLQLNNLAGTGNRVLLADPSGNLTALPAGSSGQFLQSNGTWASLPAGASAWTGTGNKLSLGAGGLLGIGVTPSYPLDVAGDAHISNNLIVDGGVVLTDINKTASGIQLNVGGSANFSGPVTARQGIMFDNANTRGISFTPASGSNPDVFNFGGNNLRPLGNLCNNPNTPTALYDFPSVVRIFDANTSGYTGGNVMTMQSWFNGSSIDVAGGGGLLINYFCGKDVSICKGSNGGFVSMGDNVEIGTGFVRDPSVSLFMNSRLDNTAMQIQGNFSTGSANNYLVKYYTTHTQSKIISVQDVQQGYLQTFLLNADGSTNQTTASNSNPMITIKNTGLPKPVFQVLGNGQTFVGQQRLVGSDPNSNAMLQVDGKIAAKEIYVIKPANWADYVFEQGYKLSPLSEVEKFYRENNRLPNVPGEKEILEKGFDVAGMDATLLRKIEELTIYIVEQNKEIEALKKEIEQIKHK